MFYFSVNKKNFNVYGLGIVAGHLSNMGYVYK